MFFLDKCFLLDGDSDTIISSEEEEDIEIDIEFEMKQWAIENNITNMALTSLLKILKKFSCFSHLPSDGRSLLKTNRSNVCSAMGDGEYAYFGVEKFLPETNVSRPFSLSINVDGLPLYKSSSKQFWPILGCLNDSSPFVIAIYCGDSKPNVEEFLRDFVNEIKAIGSTLQLSSIICDSPARAYLKCIKSPNGYSSCDKCTVQGSHDRHVYFDELECSLRDDVSFRNKLDEDHHKGTSPFEELPVDMVFSFPYDYMHSVCLGVMRRLILFWIIGPLSTRFPSNTVKEVSRSLLSYQCSLPSEFARKPRSLSLYRYWKATEFRTFLLYTGVVALKNVPKAIYKNFLLLHSAIFILCDPDVYRQLHSSAEKYLKQFVSSCKTVYGTSMLVYNVHSLLHLAKDCERFGHLDQFSCFKYENKLFQIKRKLRSTNLPLQQIVNRLSEMNPSSAVSPPTIVHKYPHFSSITGGHDSVKVKQYMLLIWNKVRFSLQEKNCFFMDFSCNYYRIENIILDDKECTYFICKKFLCIEPFYTYPLDSRIIDIVKASSLAPEYCSIHASAVYRKCCGLLWKDCVVLLPQYQRFN